MKNKKRWKRIETGELREIQLDLLKYIDGVCRKYEIPYWLFYGSLLGAVRHQGYIPWDDDIDIALMRPDYERLKQVVRQEQHPCYFMMHEEETGYYYTFGRMVDSRTLLFRPGKPAIPDLGVFIDIFPLDHAPDSEKERRAWQKDFHDLQMKTLWTVPNQIWQEPSLHTILRRIRQFPKRMRYGVKNYTGYKKAWKAVQTQFNEDSNRNSVISESTKWIYPKEWFTETTYLRFEGILVPVPSKWDSILKQTYGDYWKLPPEKDRVNKHHFTAYWKRDRQGNEEAPGGGTIHIDIP